MNFVSKLEELDEERMKQQVKDDDGKDLGARVDDRYFSVGDNIFCGDGTRVQHYYPLFVYYYLVVF